jgi:hypothetical protein
MGTSISTNVNSLNAQESFRRNSDFQAGEMRRLTSGYRTSRAVDRPAGLTIANRFRAESARATRSAAPFCTHRQENCVPFMFFHAGPKRSVSGKMPAPKFERISK